MKSITVLLLCAKLVSTLVWPIRSAASAPVSLHAYSAVLYDATYGRVLFEKNGYEKLPIASTTKILTLLLVLEHTKPTDMLTVSKNAAMQPDVQLGIQTGEQYFVGDLCYSLMLESHNDSAVALAEHVSGSTEAFATLMNQKAKTLQAYSAHFVTPNGLDLNNNGCTAQDLARIASHAIKDETFLKITNTQSHTFSEQTKGRSFTVNNKNRFLQMMDGAIGIKTGFTGMAGYCFVGAVKREDRTLVSVVLASGWPPHKNYKWEDTKALMNYGLTGFAPSPLLSSIDQLPMLSDVPVQGGKQDFVSLVYPEPVLERLLATSLLLSSADSITYQAELSYDVLSAPVQKNSRVGTLSIVLDGCVLDSIPIETKERVDAVDFAYLLKKVVSMFFLQ